MTIALYLRISREDKSAPRLTEAKKESNSIKGQRSILADYIKGKPEFADAQIVEFCDDGYSGRNFDRPGVRQMIEQAKKGAIQCIIVKDLSRFGRNYLEAGNYMLRVFPFLGVRFISVNDGYDSMRPMEADSLEVPFQTLLYDIYSRDLSRKVKSALYTKAQRGDYVAAFAPYGYQKDPADKNRIVPDEEAAAQVRRIFQMAACGQSTMQIARALNEEQVPTPSQYRQKNGCSHTGWKCIGAENFWTQQSVRKILRDERYTGKAVYGRKKRENAGDIRQAPVLKAGWITADNAHQGIVSREEFGIVQAKLCIGRERGRNKPSGRPLLGKVRCEVCGRAMIRSGRTHACFTCHTPRVAPSYDCPVLRVPEACLLHIVQDAARMQVLKTVDWQHIREEIHRLTQQEQEEAAKKLLKLQEARRRLEAEQKEIYEQYVFGGLGKQGYLAEKEKITQADKKLENQMKKLEEELSGQQTTTAGWHSQYAIASRFAADCIQEVLQEVIVCPGNLLKIVWNFRDEFAP